MEYKVIKMKKCNLSWIVMPENITNGLEHYNKCLNVLRESKEIFLEIVSHTKIIGMLFYNENDFAKPIAKIFEEERRIEGAILDFKIGKLNDQIEFLIPIKSELAENEHILLLAPPSVVSISTN